MSGGQVGGSLGLDFFPQYPEFDDRVAAHTGIGGAALEVFVHEVIHHLMGKVRAQVQDFQGNA